MHVLRCLVLVVAVALGLAACGESDGGDQGRGESSYLQSYRSACAKIDTNNASFARYQKGFESQFRADPSTAVQGYRGAATAYIRTAITQIGVLSAAEPPKAYAAFQRSFREAAAPFRDNLRKVLDTLASLREVSDLPSVGKRLDAIGSGRSLSVNVPGPLLKAAPACSVLRD